MSQLRPRDAMKTLLTGELTTFQSYVKDNINSVHPQLSNERLIQEAMKTNDKDRVLTLLQANSKIDTVIYSQDLSAKPVEFVVAVCPGLLASGYPVTRMCRALDSIISSGSVKDAAMQEALVKLHLSLNMPLPLKVQCRIYMKRYFSPRGRLCAHATKVQRGLSRPWSINIFDVVCQLPLPAPLKDYLLLADLFGYEDNDGS